MDLWIMHEKNCYWMVVGQRGNRLWAVHRGRKEGQGAVLLPTQGPWKTQTETQEAHGSLSIRILKAWLGYPEHQLCVAEHEVGKSGLSGASAFRYPGLLSVL